MSSKLVNEDIIFTYITNIYTLRSHMWYIVFWHKFYLFGVCGEVCMGVCMCKKGTCVEVTEQLVKVDSLLLLHNSEGLE